MRAEGPTGRRADGPTGRWAVFPSSRRPVGTTLVELLVVLSILAVIASVSALSVVSLRVPASARTRDSLRSARDAAIRSGLAQVIWIDNLPVRLLPDGRVLGGPVDPLTGKWLNDTER